MDMNQQPLKKKPGEFRPGKTKRDHASGAWAQCIANRQARADKQNGSKK